MKKLLLLVALIATLVMVSPAVADEYSYQDGDGDVQMMQGGINLFATGIAIGPIETSWYEQTCRRFSGESFYWGGLSIDVLAVQAIGQTMSVGGGNCCYGGFGYQSFENKIKLVTPNMTLKMEQNGYQQAQSGSYGGPSVR